MNSKGQNGRNEEVDKERPVATEINDDGFFINRSHFFSR
jgi:hypothetical protein